MGMRGQRGSATGRVPSGVYRFYVENFPLGQIAVSAPERVFSKPSVALNLMRL